MPQVNRDKESLYAPGRLSLWFTLSSAALMISLVWMLWADYDRPWKKTQADFYRRQAALLDVEKRVSEAEQFGDREDASPQAVKDRARLRDLQKQLADASRALQDKDKAAEIRRLEAEAKEQKTVAEEAANAIKAVKGDYSAARFDYEEELILLKAGKGSQKKADALKVEIDRLAQMQGKEEEKARTAEIAKAAADESLRVLRADQKKLADEMADLRAKVDAAETQRAAAEARTEKNQWRNLPVVDFLAPSITIDKVVVPGVHDDYVFASSPKVDMCLTCHRGADKDIVSEWKVRDLLAGHLRLLWGEKAWNQVKGSASADDRTEVVTLDGHKGEMRAWKGLWRTGAFKPWLLSETGSPFETWGTASTFDLFLEEKDLAELEQKKDAKTLAVAREAAAKRLEPAIGKEEVDKIRSGKVDPIERFRVKPVEWAHPHLDVILGAKSPHKLGSIGCTVCHEGIGITTDFQRATHNPRDEKQENLWKTRYGWRENELWEFPMIPLQYVQGQCLKCHLPRVQYPPYPELLKRTYLRNPTEEDKDKRELSRSLVLAPAPVDGPAGANERYYDKATEAELERMSPVDRRAAEKATLSPEEVARAAHGTWHPEKLESGIETVATWGCTGCHRISDFGTVPGWPRATRRKSDPVTDVSTPVEGSMIWADTGPPKVGPDPTHIAEKTTKEFVIRWIMNPTRFREDTRMPSFFKYVAMDDHYRPVGGAKQDKTVIVDPTEQDVVQMDVEVHALAAALFADSKPFEKPYPKVPAGDAKQGAEAFYSSANCSGCHVGRGKFGSGGALVADDGARFKIHDDDLPPGPRLDALGSKVKAEWLYAWILEPRHYWSTTRMPWNRLRDVMSADGKTVVRSAEQTRADLVAYLMEGKSPDFEAQPLLSTPTWTVEHNRMLIDFWTESFGKGQKLPGNRAVWDDGRKATAKDVTDFAGDVATGTLGARKRDDMLVDVGRKLLGYRGCFGCHNVAGYEKEQPIGKDLSAEGSQDIHKFDFGKFKHHELQHTRWAWIDKKIEQPRIFDKDTFKPRWPDKLRMPKFNFRTKDREEVVGVVLGLVKEPITAVYQPNDRMKRIAAGRAVIERYNCAQCHTIEGRRGILTAEGTDKEGRELWMLPPNLYGEGNRVHADWLFAFLKNPDSVPTPDHSIRPSTIHRMPAFRFSDEEANALVDYFLALAGRSSRLWTDPAAQALDETPYASPATIKVRDKTLTVANELEEAKLLFDTFNCVKCHLPKGTPGADPNEGASAPPFTLSRARLRRDWVHALIEEPQTQINGTKMTAFWPAKAVRGRKHEDTIRVEYPEFKFGLRADPAATNDRVAHKQMEMISRYLTWHYQGNLAPTLPAEGGK
jgi:mono/diheme cytochrome c family protein